MATQLVNRHMQDLAHAINNAYWQLHRRVHQPEIDYVRAAIREYLANNPLEYDADDLVTVDSGAFDGETLQKILDGYDNIFDVLQDIVDEAIFYLEDSVLENDVADAVCQALEYCNVDPHDPYYDEYTKYAETVAYDSYTVTGIRDMAKGIYPRVNVHLPTSEYVGDICYEDVADVLKILGINPSDVAQYFETEDVWPNLFWKDLTGLDPALTPKEFAELLINMPYHGGFYFLVTINLLDYYENKEKYNRGIVVPKHTPMVLHNYWNGSGSIIVHLRRNVVLLESEYTLMAASDTSHSIKTLHGLSDYAWTEHVIRYATEKEMTTRNACAVAQD